LINDKKILGRTTDLINNIARANKLTVIEDVAQAHGSLLGNKRAGSFGKFSCFSFYPTKNLGEYGDGGMILTDDKKSAVLLRLLRNYGKKDNPFDSEILGYNSRLDELQAAILRVKLPHLDEMNKKRAKLVKLYKEMLDGYPLEFLSDRKGAESNHHILNVMCRSRRNNLIRFLESNNIQTNVYYPTPLHLMNAFKKYVGKNEKFPNSERASEEALALPLYPELSRKSVIFIAGKIIEFFYRNKVNG